MADSDDPGPDARPTALTWFVRGCGCLTVLAVAAILIPAFSRANGGRRFSCPNNLKQIGLSLQMYSNEDARKLYPALSREAGRLMFDPATMYPEYLPDRLIVLCICPKDEDYEHFKLDPDEHYIQAPIDPGIAIDDWSYYYLGYAVRNEEDMERFAAAYQEHVLEGKPLQEDILDPDDPNGGRTLYRLREGVEHHFLLADEIEPGASARMQSEIPILIERRGNHKPDGAHVLYFDGHVEFIEYPGKWPMTEKTIGILNGLDALRADAN